MPEPSGQVSKALHLLAENAEIIDQGLRGSIRPVSRVQARSIDTLVSIKALIPQEEDTYRLNPRLREFLSDHLSHFNAFQALTRLRDRISQVRVLWGNFRALRGEGHSSDAAKIEWALDDAVTEIVYAMDQNLTLLNSFLSTNFGNVTSLAAKIRQNRFYVGEVKKILEELRQAEAIVDEIDSESKAIAYDSIRTLFVGRIRSRQHHWITRLNDIQREISKRLYQTRNIETRLRNLGKATLWLTQNRATPGFEMPPNAVVTDQLLTAVATPARWHFDPLDTDPVVLDSALVAVTKMPAAKTLRERPEDVRGPVVVLSTAQESLQAEPDPVEDLIADIEDLARDSGAVISLLRCKREAEREPSSHGLAIKEVPDEHWLLYAAGQLALRGLDTSLKLKPRERRDLNYFFDDIEVRTAVQPKKDIQPCT